MSETKINWYVGLLKAYQDKKVAQSLDNMGIEHFFPVQKIRRRWSDRIKIIENPILRGLMFIRTDDKTRKALLDDIYGLYAYMVKIGGHAPLTIPNKQMDIFRDFVTKNNEPIEFHTEKLKAGDKVRVIKGPLTGFECELLDIEGKNYLRVQLTGLGDALATVSLEDVEKMK